MPKTIPTLKRTVDQATKCNTHRRGRIRRVSLYSFTGKQVFYALHEEEKRLGKLRGAVNVTRFKGRGEMNPQQLRESTVHPETRGWAGWPRNPEPAARTCLQSARFIGLTLSVLGAPDTRRLVQLTNEDDTGTRSLVDMLLAKKHAGDRRHRLERTGDLATLEV